MENIKLQSVVVKDQYTDYIEEHFDLKVGDVCEVEIPNRLNLDKMKDWNIGLICGGSGSGKSTILKNIGKISEPIFDSKKSLISNFDKLSPQEAANLLCAVGICSVPTWLKPFNVLSNGEMYRANLAKSIYDAKDGEIILIDEFTSVVDRDVAKSMSFAVQKFVRRKGIKIIFASCHYDIIEWILPDWIYDLNKGGTLEKSECLRQRPKIELQIYRAEADTWQMFKKHHYMTQELNTSAACYIFTWNERVVGFVGVLPLPSGTLKRAVRGHRSVVLPEFQGIGIGSAITSFVASIYKAEGYRYFTKTVNPKLGEYRDKSLDWESTAHSGKFRKDVNNYDINNGRHKYKSYLARVSYCHEYVGKPTYGYEDLMLPIQDMRERKYGNIQLSLF